MKAKRSSQNIKQLALSAMFSALGTVILFFGGMLGDLDLTFSAVASLIILICIIEMGVKRAALVYAVTSLIALLIFPAYFITPMYICFVGFYPIVKYFADRRKKLLSAVIKLAVMNVMLTAILVLGSFVYKINLTDIDIPGVNIGNWAILCIYLLANVTLLVFDYCLNGLMIMYNVKLRKVLGIYKLFR